MEVGIIGSGMVVATAAYIIMLRKTASEIVLIDVNNKRDIAKPKNNSFIETKKLIVAK